jgi:hypothetical protein
VDATVMARLLAVGRAGIGLALLVAPARSTAVWFGEDSDHPAAQLASRALGAREIGLGVGALAALGDGRAEEARRWLTAGIAADLTDAVLTAASDRPGARRGAVVALAASGAAVGLLLRSRLR